jgi:hypothetical protein
VLILLLLECLETVAYWRAVAAGGGAGGGGFEAAGADARGSLGAVAGAKGAGVTTSTTLSNTATCDLTLVISPRRWRTVSTKAEIESVCFCSSLWSMVAIAVGS